MMQVSIGIDIMEGLVMECNKGKGEPPLGMIPVNAVISCKKNVSNSRQIATHVPSLPLSVPSASFGDKVHNFLVRWPADFDPHGDALSTFKLQRLMKRDAFYSDGPGLTSGFVPEEIELTIGLMRGSEMLTLGKAHLVITGNETEEMIIDLPISNARDVVKNKKRDPSPLKRTNSKLFGKKSTIKVLKPLSFPGDKRRKFHLTENAMIRLQVQIFQKNTYSASSPNGHSQKITPTYSNSYTSDSSSSYTNKDTTITALSTSQEFSSREDVASFANLSSSSKDEFAAVEQRTAPYTGNGQNYNDNYANVQKYHQRVPMDEFQEDFAQIRLASEMRRHAQLQSRHGNGNGHGMPPYSQPPHSVTTKPSSNGRAFGNEMPSYTQQRVEYMENPGTRSPNPRSLRSKSSRRSTELPPHSSGAPRSSSQKVRKLPYDNSHDSSYHATRSGSRTRATERQGRSQGGHSQMNNYIDIHDHHSSHVPRGSFNHNSDDIENNENAAHYQVEQRQYKSRSSSRPMTGKPRIYGNDSEESNESTMSWLYDKIVGTGTSADETVVKNNQSRRKNQNDNEGSTYDYKRPSPKRTMRV